MASLPQSAQIYAILLDRGEYYCSIRSMYRILKQNGQIKERRNQLKHPNYTKPELLATSSNQLWSWDITKLKGPAKWTYFYLYVILDVFSRYVVGWLVAHRESSALAKKLIQEASIKQNIQKEQLTIHADRGPSMKSKALALFLSDLGINKTHGRPHVSNDNILSSTVFSNDFSLLLFKSFILLSTICLSFPFLLIQVVQQLTSL